MFFRKNLDTLVTGEHNLHPLINSVKKVLSGKESPVTLCNIQAPRKGNKTIPL